MLMNCFFFFQAEDGIRDLTVTGVQTCALPPCVRSIAVVRLSGGLRRWAASVVETRPRREPRRRQVQRASQRPEEGPRDERTERRQPELDVRHLHRGDDGYERL